MDSILIFVGVKNIEVVYKMIDFLLCLENVVKIVLEIGYLILVKIVYDLLFKEFVNDLSIYLL